VYDARERGFEGCLLVAAGDALPLLVACDALALLVAADDTPALFVACDTPALLVAGDTLALLVACDTLPLSRRSLPTILRMDSLKAFVASKLATPFPLLSLVPG
jgi:hypothetical protein